MPVGKGFDRANLRSFNGCEVPENNTRDLLGSGGSNTVLTDPIRQGSGTLPLSPAPASERAELTYPKQDHGPCQPVRHQARTQ